jgi:hypothetical protein
MIKSSLAVVGAFGTCIDILRIVNCKVRISLMRYTSDAY